MIKVQDKYKEIYRSKQPIILLTGGRGGAKSFNAQTFICRLSVQKNHKILVTRYTMTSAEISIIPEFEEKIKLDGFSSIFNVTKKDVINTASGSEIMFRGIKTSSGNQTANLKSIQGLTTFVVDEAEEWQNEEEFDTIFLSIRTSVQQNRVIIIMNPSNTTHWVYKKWIENSHRIEYIDNVPVQISTHPDVLHIHSTYLDAMDYLSDSFLNEINNLRKEQLDLLEQIESTENNKAKAELELKAKKTKYATKIIGRWSDNSEGAIFTYSIGDFDNSLAYCYGQDYGFSVDPTTLVKVALDKKNKKLYVKEEFYAVNPRLSTSEIYDINKSRIAKPNDMIVGDSAESRLINELKGRGLNIVPARKGAGSIAQDITDIQDYQIIVEPNSFKLIHELNNYIWNDKKANIPIDDHNHAIDAMRYAFRALHTKRQYGIYV